MIPGTIKQSLDRYIQYHIPTGGFLEAVLSNDLKEAFGRADKENRIALFEIVKYCYNELPSDCWGSPEKVDAWLAERHTDLATIDEAHDLGMRDLTDPFTKQPF